MQELHLGALLAAAAMAAACMDTMSCWITMVAPLPGTCTTQGHAGRKRAQEGTAVAVLQQCLSFAVGVLHLQMVKPFKEDLDVTSRLRQCPRRS